MKYISKEHETPPKMRCFIDGCFDLFHYGHANAIRQARGFCDYLLVGVNSSATIKQEKNIPIMTDKERAEVVKSCRWVDEVIEDAPYMFDYGYMNKYKLDMVMHGDDEIVDEAGNDCYAKVKAEGKFKCFERSYGISTTELVGRLLYRDMIDRRIKKDVGKYHCTLLNEFALDKSENLSSSPDFYAKKKHIVFVEGSFDLYHAGHASLIKEAKTRGDYLLVGLNSDNEIYRHKMQYPIMKTIERKLSLMSNKYIDEILDNTPFIIDDDFVREYNIKEIVCGPEAKKYYKDLKKVEITTIKNEFHYLNSNVIIERIWENYEEFEKKVKKKRENE